MSQNLYSRVKFIKVDNSELDIKGATNAYLGKFVLYTAGEWGSFLRGYETLGDETEKPHKEIVAELAEELLKANPSMQKALEELVNALNDEYPRLQNKEDLGGGFCLVTPKRIKLRGESIALGSYNKDRARALLERYKEENQLTQDIGAV